MMGLALRSINLGLVCLALCSCLSLPPRQSASEAGSDTRSSSLSDAFYYSRSNSTERSRAIPVLGLRSWDDPNKIKSTGRSFWPLYSYERYYQGTAKKQLDLFASLLRWQSYEDPIPGFSISPIAFLLHHESFKAQSKQRIWPLYSWVHRVEGKKRFELDLAASLFRYRHTPNLQHPPHEIFLPNIVQSSSSNGFDIRLLWGILRLSDQSRESAYTVAPLFNWRSDPEQSSFSILAGLIKYRRRNIGFALQQAPYEKSSSLRLGYFWTIEL